MLTFNSERRREQLYTALLNRSTFQIHNQRLNGFILSVEHLNYFRSSNKQYGYFTFTQKSHRPQNKYNTHFVSYFMSTFI